MYSKIPRHLEQVHYSEVEVAKILILPKNSKSRKSAWKLIANKGDHAHNQVVRTEKKGIMLSTYRMGKRGNQDVADYLPCVDCLGTYKRNDLWKHQKTCVAASKTKCGKGSAQGSGRLMIATSTVTSMDKLTVAMKDDLITCIVKEDELIKKFGAALQEKYGGNAHLRSMVTGKMRELARLVENSREEAGIRTLKELLHPQAFDQVKRCVRSLTGYNEASCSYKNPSLAMKIGTSLKKCALICLTEGLKSGKRADEDDARRYLELHNAEFKSITSKAKENLELKRYNKAQTLPLFEDVHCINSFISNEAKKCKEQAASVSTYVKMAKLNLAAVILFNRKRSGEAERITITNYRNGLALKGDDVDQEIVKQLSPVEQKLIGDLKRVELRGKRGRKVPILLTKEMVENLNFMLAMREQFETRCSDDFMFARPGNSEFPYRGHEVLKQLALEAGCKRPDLITSTKLRKHLATMSIALNIGEDLQDHLANFMGHDIRIHRHFYRMPMGLMEKAKLSQILSAVNNGQILKYKGKNLEDINVYSEGKCKCQLFCKLLPPWQRSLCFW